MHITKTLKPLLVFGWRMKAVLIARLTPVAIKVPALFFLLLLSFRLLPKEFLAHFILGFIVTFSSLLTSYKFCSKYCRGLTALKENNSSNREEERSGVRAELCLLCFYLKVASSWVSLWAWNWESFYFNHSWRAQMETFVEENWGNTIFQPRWAVRSLGTMQWSIMQLDLSWKCVRRVCKVQTMCKGKFGLVIEMSSEQWVWFLGWSCLILGVFYGLWWRL